MLNKSKLDKLCAGESDQFKSLVSTYVGEAMFFDQLLSSDIDARPEVRRIIEVGAGIGLLSLLLAERGYEVVAFEPESAGFGEMQRIRGYLFESWDGDLPHVTWINDYLGAELPEGVASCDYGISLNVLEHVPDTEEFLTSALGAIKRGAPFRMIFPNYLFPYEPHFNFPTLISKRLTGRLWRKRISNSTMSDPMGMWNDLSWPTPRKVRRSAHRVGAEAEFTRDAVAAYFDRAASDSKFVERKGVVGRYILRPVGRIARVALPAIPKAALPVIDVRFTKR